MRVSVATGTFLQAVFQKWTRNFHESILLSIFYLIRYFEEVTVSSGISEWKKNTHKAFKWRWIRRTDEPQWFWRYHRWLENDKAFDKDLKDLPLISFKLNRLHKVSTAVRFFLNVFFEAYILFILKWFDNHWWLYWNW